MDRLTPEEKERFALQKDCYLCGEELLDPDDRDLDHCHYTGSCNSIFNHDNISISDKNKLMYFPDVRPLPERKFYGSNNHLHDGLERAHLQRKEMGSCEVLFGRLPRGLKPWEAHYKLEEK